MTAATNATTHRLALHAAALATLGTCPTWDKAVTEYLARAALATADEAFGTSWQKRYDLEMAEHALASEHGKHWRDRPDLAPRARELARADDAIADERAAVFQNPTEEAAHELVRIPAPTIAAALLKVELIDRHQLWDDVRFETDGLAIVHADIARISGIAPSDSAPAKAA
ncbi:MAG: hypothetical protein B7Y36_11145 [Novosphingobium sp. 28-62-57]|uniref:hypothetical protein n=1 Tax=unclassified Novosphingobium TaxID=2644732 RepID=UPI000BD8BCD0|nr:MULTISPECIES: hypothetical protein [unclassified Novosphingobium]OYW50923.1 MAG: hypothetical protein B7Z34_03690 [Novosphingobium sp. 12-62-10]OYZ09939.1 MAG: hypothetical protein B7Y36_11145 [Novosphingobium sp. 28-62-57]HQS71101.1 hypothetical protein [Novosphingobium sp.]